MIGIFDSGLGGVQTLHYIQKELPDYNYVFLADNAHVPYGDKTPDQIRSYTFECLNRLFDNGCELVIIACNTAAAYSIRERQSTYPEKKTLSVTIPGIEAIDRGGHRSLTILATQATIDAKIYEDLLQKNNFTGNITNIPANNLVSLIENTESDISQIQKALQNHFKDKNTSDTLVLGCTHFPIIHTQIKKLRNGPIIDPGYDAAIQLATYLSKHPEIEKKISKGKKTTYYTTGSVSNFNKKVFHILSQTINTQKAILSQKY